MAVMCLVSHRPRGFSCLATAEDMFEQRINIWNSRVSLSMRSDQTFAKMSCAYLTHISSWSASVELRTRLKVLSEASGGS